MADSRSRRRDCLRRIFVAGAAASLCVVGGAWAAFAASTSDAADAADIIADGLSTKLKSSERSCLVTQLRSSSDVASEVVSSGDLDSVDDTTGGAVLGMVADCAPRLLVDELTGRGVFDGIDIPKSEVQCFAKGFGNLDSAVLAAAVGDSEFEDLPTDQQDQVVTLMFDCMPTGVGRLMYSKIVPKGGSKTDEKQARCLGQGFGDAVGDAGGVAVFSGDDPPPEVVGSMMHVMADCTPDALVAVFTKSFRQSGAPAKVATCVAKGIVKDEDLIDTIVDAQAGEGTMPPALQRLVSKCS